MFLKEEQRSLIQLLKRGFFFETPRVYTIADIIKNGTGIPHIIDYKISKSMTMYDEYKLQFTIQSLCFSEEKGFIDHRVGIYFLMRLIFVSTLIHRQKK